MSGVYGVTDVMGDALPIHSGGDPLHDAHGFSLARNGIDDKTDHFLLPERIRGKNGFRYYITRNGKTNGPGRC
jgi:hypothetical protein